MSDASEALAEGTKASAAGDLATAQRWLDRALRLAPGNTKVILALAGVRLLQRSSESADLFGSVVQEHDLREAWQGLAIAFHQRGDTVGARDALSHALSRHAYIKELAPTANVITVAANAPGWCGLDGAGRLVVQLTSAAASGAKPSVMVEQRPVNVRTEVGGRGFVAQLPSGWERARNVVVRLGARALLGSPVDIGAIVRLEGFVASTDGDLHGWAWHPHDPDRDPRFSVRQVAGKSKIITLVADTPVPTVWHERPMDQLRGFLIPAARLLHFSGPVSLYGPDGRNLIGSPLDPSAERISAKAGAGYIARQWPAAGRARRSQAPEISRLSLPAQATPATTRGGATKRPVDVIVPVYGKIDLTLRCLDSVLRDLPRWARLVVVDDASPDPRVRQELSKLARRRRIKLLEQPLNRGFPSAANAGLRHDPTRDVVLLNSDTLTPPGWLQRLRNAAYLAPDIGSATPLSNDGSIVSYPSVDHANPIPGLNETVRLDAMAQQANAGCVVDLPTAVGFCMYIKRDCLNATGLFREDLFAQGYGEENDFCLRARHLGWRHVAVPGIFVAHVGGQSFGSSKNYLLDRNLATLNRLHPGYDELIRDFQKRDPLAEPRRRLDMERWKTFRSAARSVLLVTHDQGGGVQRHVSDRAAVLRAERLRPILLSPVSNRSRIDRVCVLSNGPEAETPNLRFVIPDELDILAGFLRADRPLRAEIHQMIGHDHALLRLFRRLRVPYEIVIHDYSWICPRVSLVGKDSRYCGEPDVAHCDACVADTGAMNDEDIATRALRERSSAELRDATRVVAPSKDTAARLQRHFPQIEPEVIGWEDDGNLPPAERPALAANDVRRVCVVGAIGIAKGYEVLLACARDAALHKLQLEFCLVGYSMDDARLLATGKVHITGRYKDHEAVGLIRAQQAQLGWLPSLWPETWCYTLSQAWQAGLNVLAFDIGAPAERVRRTGRGWLCPLGLSASALNGRLMTL